MDTSLNLLTGLLDRIENKLMGNMSHCLQNFAIRIFSNLLRLGTF